jgi:SAM-dependent methyltransferase
MNVERAGHWDDVYARRAVDEVSWFEPAPSVSLRLIEETTPRDAGVIDVGAGASGLVEALRRDGYSDLTALDVSRAALEILRRRLGEGAEEVSLIAADLLEWTPGRAWHAWHDRAVFHFLVEPGERSRYVATAARAVLPGGVLVVGAFARDGPRRCSGLPTAGYGPGDLADAFAPAFSPIRSERQGHRTPAGTVQPFTWMVLRRAQTNFG